MTNKHDRSYGCRIGSFIGDSLGGRYEFMSNYLQQIEKDIQYCNGRLDILGGGVHRLEPGQITDDSELALTLAQNILDHKKPDRDSLPLYYNKWYASDPFDIGNTTKNSFSKKNRVEMLNASKLWNDKSLDENGVNCLTNGALMRLAPLCIFCAGYLNRFTAISVIQLSKLRSLLKTDTQLTNNSEEALNYCYFFLLLCVSGIIYGNLDVGFVWIETMKEYHDDVDEPYQILHNATLIDAKLVHDPKDQQGDMRIAYQLAIRKALMCQTGSMTFDEAVISTIKLGGDTDTNACIVGMLCGSVTGSREMPSFWIDRVIDAKPDRYAQYSPLDHLSNPLKLAYDLFSIGNKYDGMH